MLQLQAGMEGWGCCPCSCSALFSWCCQPDELCWSKWAWRCQQHQHSSIQPIQPLCLPSSVGRAYRGVRPGSSPETFQHPGACSSVQGELHNTWCLYTQPARSFVLLLPAFVNSSDHCVQPLKTMPYFSLPSLLSWHNSVSSSSFNPNELPSAYDYRVALPVACTVSSLTVSFTSCAAISLAWLRQPAQLANILNKSQGEPYILDRFCFI